MRKYILLLFMVFVLCFSWITFSPYIKFALGTGPEMSGGTGPIPGTGASGGGSGDVTASSSFGTDNVIIRSDGTGKGVQSSGIAIDDSDNMSGIETLTATTLQAGSGTPDISFTTDGNGKVTEGAINQTNNESLSRDYETATNTCTVASATGVTEINYGSIDLVTTGNIIGALGVITSAGAISLTEAQLNQVIIVTAAGDVDLPDSCDSATGHSALIYVRDVAETVSLTVTDTSDTIIYKGLSLGADDELDSPGAAQDWVCVVCMETNNWYVVGNSGDWTDGGVPD